MTYKNALWFVKRVNAVCISIITIVVLLLLVTARAGASVERDGSFSYNYPIGTDSAIGPEPHLAINYNSNNANGLLGIGWQLSGLSRIFRTHLFSGDISSSGNIQYNGSDTYGSSMGGVLQLAEPDVYHTKRESFVKYEPQGLCNDGPCSWIVTLPDGTKQYYGKTANSQVLAIGKNGSIREWLLSNVVDLHGNELTVQYINNSASGKVYPDYMLYNNGNNKVQFTYEDRTDIDESYYLGSRAVLAKRSREEEDKY